MKKLCGGGQQPGNAPRHFGSNSRVASSDFQSASAAQRRFRLPRSSSDGDTSGSGSSGGGVGSTEGRSTSSGFAHRWFVSLTENKTNSRILPRSGSSLSDRSGSLPRDRSPDVLSHSAALDEEVDTEALVAIHTADTAAFASISTVQTHASMPRESPSLCRISSG